jgi:hypothetical protein
VYIPALGRFAQLDPVVGGSANGYDYANQDPIGNTDPSGNETDNWLMTGLTALASAGLAALVAPARGALVGMLVGAVAGAAVAGVVQLASNYFTGQSEFSVTRMGLSILAGAVGGGIRGRVKWSRAQNRANGNVNGPPQPKAPAPTQPAQAPQLPRQNLGKYQATYDETFNFQTWRLKDPLLGPGLFGVAPKAEQIPGIADRFAMGAVKDAQKAAAVAKRAAAAEAKRRDTWLARGSFTTRVL